MFRYYVCPIVQDPSEPTNNIAKVMLYPSRQISIVTAIGSNWCLAKVEADDFTLIDSDPDNKDIFEKLTDAAGVNKSSLITFLKSTTVGQVPVNIKNNILNKLLALGIDLTGITNASFLWDVIIRVHRVHTGRDNLEAL